MKPFHEELKEIRLENNISLEHIHEVTKIRIVLLEKIEEGDTSIAPAPIIRAFLREYAQAVGIDPERVIKRYENKVDSIREPERHNVAPAAEKQSETIPEENVEPMTDTSVPELPVESEAEPVEAGPEAAEEVKANEETDTKDTGKISETDSANTRPEEPAEKIVDKPHEPSKTDIAETAAVSEPLERVEEPTPEPNLPDDHDTTELNTEPQRVPTRRSRLEIEEPDGANKLAVVIFVIIIIIAAAVVFWINN